MSDPFVVLRTIFTLCLLATLVGGVYLFRHFDKLFGADASIPSETEGARFYTKTEVFLVWASAVKLFAVAVWFI
jgi:hypothetical protein